MTEQCIYCGGNNPSIVVSGIPFCSIPCLYSYVVRLPIALSTISKKIQNDILEHINCRQLLQYPPTAIA
jgi:hypothetical protein